MIYQHTWFNATGNLPGESTPEDLAQLAARHPDASLICGHTGGDWERGLRAIRHLTNVYSDLAGSDPVAGYTEDCRRHGRGLLVPFGSVNLALPGCWRRSPATAYASDRTRRSSTSSPRS